MIVARIWSLVERLVLAALVLLFAAMVVACTAQVIWRYLFNDPLVWSEELARYLFIWISYLSAWVAWKSRSICLRRRVIVPLRPPVGVISSERMNSARLAPR